MTPESTAILRALQHLLPLVPTISTELQAEIQRHVADNGPTDNALIVLQALKKIDSAMADILPIIKVL